VLLYVTGGLTYAHVKLSGPITNPLFRLLRCRLDKRLSDGLDGGRGIGIGVRAERVGQGRNLYYDLGSVSQQVLDPRTQGAFIARSVGFRGNIVRPEVNYRFYGVTRTIRATGIGRLIDKRA
jgi:hypothetical protein